MEDDLLLDVDELTETVDVLLSDELDELEEDWLIDVVELVENEVVVLDVWVLEVRVCVRVEEDDTLVDVLEVAVRVDDVIVSVDVCVVCVDVQVEVVDEVRVAVGDVEDVDMVMVALVDVEDVVGETQYPYVCPWHVVWFTTKHQSPKVSLSGLQQYLEQVMPW